MADDKANDPGSKYPTGGSEQHPHPRPAPAPSRPTKQIIPEPPDPSTERGPLPGRPTKRPPR